MIPIIPIIIPSSGKDHGGRRPSQLGILLSVAVFSIGMFLAFFVFLAGDISSPMPIISFVVLFLTIIMGIVAFTIAGISGSSNESERRDNNRMQNISWDNDRRRTSKEYCPECGSLVEFSDSYCTTCGSRLD